MMLAPTHICTNYKKIRKKIKNVEVQNKRGIRFLQNKKNSMSGTSISVSLRAEISPLPYKKRPHLGGRSSLSQKSTF
jgi:hypothetical protein